jgi:ABC-type lipoprotein release transport system permease subunit
MVYGLRTFDVPVSGGVIAVTIGVILLATFLAARRALLIQPLESLKQG